MSNIENIKAAILESRCYLGIEFGSTRIKGVLIDESHEPIASGAHDWENRLEGKIWTYTLDDIIGGLQDCYAKLAADVLEKYGVELKKPGAIGISGMMHGYIVCDKKGEFLTGFRTWRNTITAEASEKLTAEFNYNIPQRWSIAHLYQAILNGEEHVPSIDSLHTLACYIHWRLTGKRVAGVGEASGMFPIDISTGDYDAKMLSAFDSLVAEKGYSWKLSDILPEVLSAGENAGILTEEGAKLLDPSGKLCAGIPLCPPEGDAGTGMTATNSVAKRTGNISAGTSVFAMVVLEKELSKVYPELDLVTTPCGDLVAMVHCNNCTGDIDAWVKVFGEFASLAGLNMSKSELYDMLYFKALEGDADCGGLVSYNYISGEPVTEFEEGRPLFMRTPNSKLNLANFMRTQLYATLGTLKYGMDILFLKENIALDKISGHGGLYKTAGVGQRITAAAINTPVTVMKTAGEGGPWGMAILAAYMANKSDGEVLGDYLNNKVFAKSESSTVEPDANDVAGFESFMKRYIAGLAAEKAAVESI